MLYIIQCSMEKAILKRNSLIKRTQDDTKKIFMMEENRLLEEQIPLLQQEKNSPKITVRPGSSGSSESPEKFKPLSTSEFANAVEQITETFKEKLYEQREKNKNERMINFFVYFMMLKIIFNRLYKHINFLTNIDRLENSEKKKKKEKEKITCNRNNMKLGKW
ncbi:hypothetical protein BCR32DRAFT_250655 [Anaeromyces robustus]|uniref:Uncharacterized protein n=1 Tax=Anaeromyces robustus TaxID=1754192 RepID=A0A1Y1VW56_9FUNG|nr:hypothetical protein BCR32DRAFT_250655 [Anaeromyces robustus]|eukprot:ORX65443.1 hypothetical protein BCR32DRAFT_250655 [Anaeromyces robustus]